MKKFSFGPALFIPCGIIFGFIFTELLLGILRGPPPALNTDPEFLYRYAEIHDPFFLKESSKHAYTSRRRRGAFYSEIPFKKASLERRVFIIGESVPRDFAPDILSGRLEEVFYKWDWKVFNCGMASYDSYRIGFVAEEVTRHQPDLVILMMGNNEGRFRPVKINHWPNRYRLLSAFWLGRILSEYVNPPIFVRDDDINLVFSRNLEAMAQMFSRKNVPVILCTLGANRRISRFQDFPYGSREEFSCWYLARRNPRKALRYIQRRISENSGWSWYLADCYERLGKVQEAERWYRKNRRRDQEDRNRIIVETAARHENIFLFDMDKFFESFGTSAEGFEIFWDEMHYWPAIFRLFSEEILKIMLRPGLKIKWDEPAEFKENKTGIYGSVRHEIDGNWRKLSVLSEPKERKGLLFLFRNPWQNSENLRVYFHFLHDRERDFARYFKERLADLAVLAAKDEVLTRDMDEDIGALLCIAGNVMRERGEYGDCLRYLGSAEEKVTGSNRSYLHFFRGLCYYDMGERDRSDKDFDLCRRTDERFLWLSAAFLDSLNGI